MSENQKTAAFRYSFSVDEQEEIRKIRSRYLPAEETPMDTLRRLDAQATRKASIYAIVMGAIGLLLLGTGMSCCLVWSGTAFVTGIFAGLAGMAVCAGAYPLYNRIAKRERERVAPQILKLTEELMK